MTVGTESCSLQGMVEREGEVQLNFEEWIGHVDMRQRSPDYENLDLKVLVLKEK